MSDALIPRAVIIGVRGRMGRSIVENALDEGAFVPVGGVSREPGSMSELGFDLEGPIVTSLSDAPECDVVIDFSSPSTTITVAEAAVAKRCALVVGTTGLESAHLIALEKASKDIAVVRSPNMSVGVNLLFELVSQAARVLNEGWDAEVTEAHHHHKVDAPSGTARRILEIMTAERDVPMSDVKHGREGIVGARPAGEIGMHTIRGGDVVGEHTVHLFGLGERVELSHRATDRGIFARGSLRAAKWTLGKAPGLYSMSDVLKG